MEIWELGAVELAAALRARECSAVEALAAVLERAEAVADLNPFALRLDERALSAAIDADAQLAADEGGPLCGVPLTVKDSHYMAGVPTTHGTRAIPPRVPTETVTAVRRLEAAGAVIFAKTATPEFCYAGTTPGTYNPHDPTRTPGGSSGGAAVAVAAHVGPLALGGDGGGSIRIPAAFCGVVGFKPTFGAVPREPSSQGWKTLVAYGPLARNVADARLMFETLAGEDPYDRHSVDVNLKGTVPFTSAAAANGRNSGGGNIKGTVPFRFAACDTLGTVDDEVRVAFRNVCAEVGATEDSAHLPNSAATWAAIATAEARWADAEAFASPELGPYARSFLEAGDAVSAEAYIRAQMYREEIHRAYAQLFERSGLLLTPTVGCEAFDASLAAPPTVPDWGAYLFDANLAGLPACALPMGRGRDGLPISLQITGPRGADGAVLAAAEHIEELLHVARYV
jgi:Asp-tRNA(Asn)/Glu-tRNA(Gln) amidotransferase A subunit family amidase